MHKRRLPRAFPEKSISHDSLFLCFASHSLQPPPQSESCRYQRRPALCFALTQTVNRCSFAFADSLLLSVQVKANGSGAGLQEVLIQGDVASELSARLSSSFGVPSQFIVIKEAKPKKKKAATAAASSSASAAKAAAPKPGLEAWLPPEDAGQKEPDW
jgi:hypothetical protein